MQTNEPNYIVNLPSFLVVEYMLKSGRHLRRKMKPGRTTLCEFPGGREISEDDIIKAGNVIKKCRREEKTRKA